MASLMQQFHRIEQRYPEVRPASARRQDYSEISKTFAVEDAAVQSSRCLQCGVPFCQVHCPLHNNIPDWLKLTAEGRLEDAYNTASATNTFPEICGRICPQDRLCEGSCVTEQSGFGAITIGSIEKFITETAWKEGWVKPFAPKQERAESVGIIGAGPAGLAAAEVLRRQGFRVHVYDRYDRMGGLMVYGIPNFKLDKQVVQRRIDQFSLSGIIFHPGSAVGSASLPFDTLRQRHDALLIATGVYRARGLGNIPGQELGGIVPAMEYLTASNRYGLGDRVPEITDGSLNAHGKRVMVIGGGDTAMDCVRTAVRQGARKVICLYRRDRANMPGSAREVHHAEQEGVHFQWLSAPVAFNGRDGQVDEVRTIAMRLGSPDASGRRLPQAVPGSETGMDADMVIAALGYDAEDLPAMFGTPGLETTSHGTLTVDNTGQTSMPGVFAAGDIVRGASLVVWAIADGRKAASDIGKFLDRKAIASRGCP